MGYHSPTIEVLKKSFLCISCKRQFVKPDGFERMCHKPKDIVRAVHMHEDGLHEDGFSLAKTKNHLWQHDEIKVTRWTISQWTSKYSLFLKSNKFRSKTNAQGETKKFITAEDVTKA